ncbi:antitermination protein [Serratia liquefaciens]|uniref:antitermination protein Q n=1 Tax=Serratia liquefaciens TaxID=614 RepID=UPI00076AE4EF|nr:antitermination protein [Serratia liquefaciens]AMH00925.1 antitermination protein [Serratia liquefaciens]
MRLESIPKYFSPKSPMLNDSTPATASDSLTISDVMGALGLCQAQAEFGLAAFLGKIGISETDKVKAVVLLAKHGMANCDKVAAIRKLPGEVKARVVLTLAVFAYMDYCRSAASEVPCDACDDGFIDAEVFTNKVHTPFPAREIVKMYQKMGVKKFRPSEYEVHRELRERVRVLCPKCNGKRVINTACNDCRGRCVVVDKTESERQGVPVKKPCKRCSGRGYERLPASKAYRAIQEYIPDLPESSWRCLYKPFYEQLITECEKQESIAGEQLSKVTK